MLEGFDPNSIADERARQWIIQSLNLIEELQLENRELRAEVQRLYDEIHRLNGAQGRPVLQPNNAAPAGSEGANYASEKDRQKPHARQKHPKVEPIQMDREEVPKVDRAALPADAEFKG